MIPTYLDSGGNRIHTTAEELKRLWIFDVGLWRGLSIIEARTRIDDAENHGWMTVKLYDLFENRN